MGLVRPAPGPLKAGTARLLPGPVAATLAAVRGKLGAIGMSSKAAGVIRLVLLALLLATLPANARAQEVPPTEGTSIWRLAAYKAITFETAANIADITLFALIIGGGAATTAGYFVANTATAAAAYYTHEISWNLLGPELTAETETRIAVEKTVTYRVVSIARHVALAAAFGGTLVESIAFMAAAQASDIALYYTNEVLWARYGPRPIQ